MEEAGTGMYYLHIGGAGDFRLNSSNKHLNMKTNMGTADRLIRIFLAAVFAGLYFTGIVENSLLATVLWVIGLIFFVTAAIGFCPLYALFRLDTRRKV